MRPGEVWNWLTFGMFRRHRDLKGFDEEAQKAGGVSSGLDRGMKIVPTDRIVGSVSRWQNMRSDFYYASGGVTQRFLRIRKAIRRGNDLPPLELAKLSRPPESPDETPRSEYYVIDGHHRVAEGRRIGQAFFDAHVTEFKAGGPARPNEPTETSPPETAKPPSADQPPA
jgi:hypothetical protein